ncbi:hypothetical protein A3D77_02505 [Candidatus Gottesmanbacteria bacterium RIFCSPHIGHO2_02_FULL_39_11]|uniref:Acylneuraminate cytidylyltransferase n=1 Tax=Candidatus Gottesmanbacteria bacterium RIFCSPHIGHO2_02_FULL_39_11 TaxID=1798382 RepID=A0A1F5ZUZ9_9BACT|nr:MAG: hypothetical protein A3D77_02505 [Candidatus Gottesmanbacteria bacterium RIFCSPHIGHO2_02_FULL_39_11]
MITNCIALIPARIGSKRVRSKNILPLERHPLIAYAIHAAKTSGIFSRIIVSTNSKKIAHIAKTYGGEVPFLRPQRYAADHSPDIEWIRWTLHKLQQQGEEFEYFCILRPTSPFRTAETIQRAWKEFLLDKNVDSLRAVELCQQHPAKMWKVKGTRMVSLLKTPKRIKTPWHSTPYQVLPKIYAQNASLEIAKCTVVLKQGSISGGIIRPFVTNEYEGYDINNEKDYIYAKYLIETGYIELPTPKKFS